MVKKFIILVSIIILPIISISCKESKEELKLKGDRLFSQASDYYERNYYNQAEKYFKELVKIDTELDNLERRANVFTYLGLIRYNRSDFFSAMNYYESALSDFKFLYSKEPRLNLRKSINLVLNNIAGIHSILGNFTEAISIYKKIITESLLAVDKESEIIAYLNLGAAYREMWDFEKAYEYYQKAFHGYEIINDDKGKIYTLYKIGELFLESKDFYGALKTFDMILDLNRKTNTNYLIAQTYNKIGLMYFKQKEYSKAEELFLMAEEKLIKQKDFQKDEDEYFNISSSIYDLIIVYNNLGDCAFQNQSYSKAITYYKKAFEITESSIHKFLAPIIQYKIAKSFESLYLLDGTEDYWKNAELYFNYSLNRLEMNEDNQTLSSVLTNYLSFCYCSGKTDIDNSKYNSLSKINFQFKTRPTEWELDFAIGLEKDFSFAPLFIKNNKTEILYKILLQDKASKIFSYFLRLNDFSLPSLEINETVLRLKENIYKQSSYQEILIKEKALPPQQRDKEKLNIIKSNLNSLDKLIKQQIETLTNLDKNFHDIFSLDINYHQISSEKLLIEFLPTEDNLIIFFISNKGIEAKIISTDLLTQKYDLTLIRKNFTLYDYSSFQQSIKTSFKEIIEILINKIREFYKGDFTKEKIFFLINGNEYDFIPHLFYSDEIGGYFIEKLTIGYSISVYPREIPTTGSITIFCDETLTKDLKGLNYMDKISIINVPEKLVDGSKLLIWNNLFLNSENPNQNYIKMHDEPSSRIYLNKILASKPISIVFKNIETSSSNDLFIFSGLLKLYGVKFSLLPIQKIDDEISKNFLYNYLKRVDELIDLRTFNRRFGKNLVHEDQKSFISTISYGFIYN